MQEIICHIGFPKTGTTYLQNEVFSKIKDLNYIKQINFWENYHDIIGKDDSFYDANRIKNELLKLHKENLNLLLSHEPLTGHHFRTEFTNRTQIAKRLKALGVNKIIITIRNQTDALESSYKQYIKSGGVLKLVDFFGLNKKARPYVYLDYYNYEKIIELYTDIFGIENVLILQYEEIFSKRNNFFFQLIDFLNIDDNEFKNPSKIKVNKSISNSSTKLLRILNHFTINNYRPSHLISEKISTDFLYKHLSRLKIPKNDKKLISEYEDEINSYFIDSNTALEKKYNIKLHEKYIKHLEHV